MQHILLLHGAIGSKDQLLPAGEKLADSFIVHSLNFSGHGALRLLMKNFASLFLQQK